MSNGLSGGSTASQQSAVLEPHLSEFGRGDSTLRYPNPFFDLAQQYTPRTVKELFRWCTYFYYTHPLVHSTITKISRYPITKLIIEDEDERVKNKWGSILDDTLKMKDRLMEANLDLNVYGNAFVSLHFPFTRFLVCQQCNHRSNIEHLNWKWQNYGFQFTCPKCKTSQTAHADDPSHIKDVPFRDAEEIKIVRWNPENIGLRYNEATGETTYYYNVSRTLRYQIQIGERDVIQKLPLLFLQAVRKSRLIKLSNKNLFHLKRPTLAEKDMGWGKPLIQAVMKDLYYMATLRRAQEAIANEHIVPFDFLFPQPNAQMDPFVHTDLGNWRTQVEDIVKKHRRDPNYKAILPVPIGFGRLGGDGKALMLTPELNYLNQTIVGGMGIPQEFLFGGLNWCIAPRHKLFSSKGLLKLEEICPQDVTFKEPKTNIEVNTKDGVEKVALVHRTPQKEQYTLKTRIGLDLTGSRIHRVWVLNEDISMSWKRLEDIKSGDRVALPEKSDLWGDREVSPELCRILGYLVSEGSVTQRAIEFTNSDRDLLEDFVDCIEKEFGKKFAINSRFFSKESGHYGDKEIHTVCIKDQNIKKFFKDTMGFGYSKDKTVPRIIRESKKECVFEFLKALFEGDGCNYVSPSSKQTISYASISEESLEDIQLLLLNAGIISYKYPEYIYEENEEETSLVPCLHLRSENAVRFAREIGFISNRKNQKELAECNPQEFRCEYKKIPFLLDRLKELRDKTNGSGAWVKDCRDIELEESLYTTKEVSELIGRDVSSVINYINKGKLKAKKEERKDGRFSTWLIKREDLEDFLDNHGIQKRASLGNTTWEINPNNSKNINWETVKELDPILYENYQKVIASGFIWDEVVETRQSTEKIEMCDLTVYNTHSYVAGGIVSHNTGSSITLRSLQNDFQHNQTQLLELTKWIKNKVKVFLRLPDIKRLRFMDFKMADDIQRIQQLISLNSQRKVSDETLLTELGLDYEKEVKKILSEIEIQNEMQDLMARSQAKTSGEAQLVSWNYQQKLQDLTEEAQKEKMKEMQEQGQDQFGPDQQGMNPFASEQSPVQYGQAPQGALPQGQGGGGQAEYESTVTGQPVPGAKPATTESGQTMTMDVEKMADKYASQIAKMEQMEADRMLTQIKQQMPEFGSMVEERVNQIRAEQGQGSAATGGGAAGEGGSKVNMNPMPEKGAPRRAGSF